MATTGTTQTQKQTRARDVSTASAVGTDRNQQTANSSGTDSNEPQGIGDEHAGQVLALGIGPRCGGGVRALPVRAGAVAIEQRQAAARMARGAMPLPGDAGGQQRVRRQIRFEAVA